MDLLELELQRSLAARPERLEELIRGQPSRETIVIDEVQRVPSLLDVVHRLVESRRGLRFVLTGSSARKLRHGAANLLAGRLVELRMHPFMAAEMGDTFDLKRALELGMIPLVLGAPDAEATLRSYAALYVREEVQAEALVRSAGDFSRFLEAIASLARLGPERVGCGARVRGGSQDRRGVHRSGRGAHQRGVRVSYRRPDSCPVCR